MSVLQAARQSFPNSRIFAIFQPHRYSRVQRLFDDFSRSFNVANTVLVPPIYPAGEKALEGISNEALAGRIHHFGHRDVRVMSSLEDCTQLLMKELQPNDVVITLGAGNVNQVCSSLTDRLESSTAHSS